MSNAVLNKFMNIFGMGAEEAEDEEFEDINDTYEEDELEEPKGLFGRKSNKVVNMAGQVRMVIMQPTSYAKQYSHLYLAGLMHTPKQVYYVRKQTGEYLPNRIRYGHVA